MSAPGVKSNCNTMVLNPLLARALGGPGSELEVSLAGCKSNASGARISMLERCKNVYRMKLEKLKSRMLVYKNKSRKKTWGLPPTAVNKNKNKTKKFPDELADLNSSARLAPWEVLAGVSRVVGAASGGRLAAVRTLATVCSGSTNVNERKTKSPGGGKPPRYAAFDGYANICMCSNKEWLWNYSNVAFVEVDGVGGAPNIVGMGTLRFSLTCEDGSIMTYAIHNVMCTEAELPADILLSESTVLSLPHLKSASKRARSSPESYINVELDNGHKSKIPLEVNDGLYELKLKVDLPKKEKVPKSKRKLNQTLYESARSMPTVLASRRRGDIVSANLAHNLLAHPSRAVMKLIAKNRLIKGLVWDENEEVDTCYPCAIGKSQRKAMPKAKKEKGATRCAAVIAVDIEGPIPTPAYGGYRFAIHFTCMHSRFTASYYMVKKDEAGDMLEKFIEEYIEPRQFKIIELLIDDDSVFKGKSVKFRKVAVAHGARLTINPPYCHFLHGVAERVIRTLTQKAFTVMAQRDVAAEHWAHALSHVTKIHNMLPHKALNGDTPFWIWFQSIPDCSNLHPFGCDVRVNLSPETGQRRKFIEPPGEMGIYIGFDYERMTSSMIWFPGTRTTKQRTVFRGDIDCLFFELLDANLFLRSRGDPAYKMYDIAEAGPDPRLAEAVPEAASDDFRVAKEFAGVIHFGNAKLKDKSKEGYCYEVKYDDGDGESMTVAEIEPYRLLFISQNGPDAKNVNEFGMIDLPKNVELKRIVGRDSRVSGSVTHACIKVEYTCNGESTTGWAKLCDVARQSGAHIEENWCRIRKYCDDASKKEAGRLYKCYSRRGVSPRSTANKDKLCLFIASAVDESNSTVQCVYPDGSAKWISSVTLDPVVASATAAESNIAWGVSKDDYCPFNYYDVLSMKSDLWSRATESCIYDQTVLAGAGFWEKLKIVRAKEIKTISSRFVYSIKKRPGDKYEAFARLTPRGFEEIEGEHYDGDHIFAGTPQLEAYRFIQVKSLQPGYYTFHLDYSRAFGNTPLERDVYITMPPGYHHYDEDGDECCLKLVKGLEGLKQSGANWLDMLDTAMVNMNFTRSVTEPKLYRGTISKSRELYIYILVYVDDLFCVTNAPGIQEDVRSQLEEATNVPCKNLGPITFALGIGSEYGKDGESVKLTQEKMVDDLLIKHKMTDCKGRTIPIPSNFNLEEALAGEPLDKREKQLYQSIVGSGIWLQRGTRPDIAAATYVLASGMSAPTKECMKAAKHFLQYLKATKDYSIVYSLTKNSDLDLSGVGYHSCDLAAFTDSNWSVPRSQSSSVIMYMNAALTWKTKKQRTTALSSCEAEMYAASETCRELKYAMNLLDDLRIEYGRPVKLFCDNQGAIQNAKHPIVQNNLKHVDLHAFYVRECVARNMIEIMKIAGTMNPADLGTKLLSAMKQLEYAMFLING